MAILPPSVKLVAVSLNEPIYGLSQNLSMLPLSPRRKPHPKLGKHFVSPQRHRTPIHETILVDYQSGSVEASIICTMRFLATSPGLIGKVGMPLIVLFCLLYYRLATAEVEIVREEMSQ